MRPYPVGDLGRYEAEMLAYMRSDHADVLSAIKESGQLADDVRDKLIAALDHFAEIFRPSESQEIEAA